jgi:hypothetical protein
MHRLRNQNARDDAAIALNMTLDTRFFDDRAQMV